jgi:hypothetical protein
VHRQQQPSARDTLLHQSGIHSDRHDTEGMDHLTKQRRTLLGRLRAADLPSGLTVVFELFGNSTYRWVQEDGTLALPLKTCTGYHLPGRITVCDDKVFKGLVESVLPLFHFFKDSGKVVVPPLPRYVFRGCCPEFAHAPNVAEQDHASEILSKGTHLRGILKKQLLGSGLQKFWVCEAGKVLMPTSCANTSDFLCICRRSRRRMVCISRQRVITILQKT